MLQVAAVNSLKRLGGVRPITIAALLALLAPSYLALDNSLFADGDTSWHIAAGRWILEHGTVPHVDPFSFSMPGTAWHAHEWLAEIPMALAFNLADWRGLALPFAVTFGLTLFLIMRELARHFSLGWAVAATAAVFSFLDNATLARPHLFGWAILVVWLLLLLRARERHRAPTLAAALLMIVWANMHASYIIGLGLIGVFALESLLQDRSPAATLRAWVPFGLLSLAAACLTPFGIQGFLYPFQVSQMEALSLIGEWRSTKVIRDGIFMSYFVVVIGFALLSWRRVGLARLLLTVGLAYMAMSHVRHQQVFALITVLAVLPLAMERFTGRTSPAPPASLDRRTAAWLGLGLLAIAAVRLAVPHAPDDPPGHMGGGFDAVPPELRTQPVLNSYSFGGPLILRGVKVFIDGRADMYGDRFTIDYQRMADGDMALFREAQRRYGFRWTILWHPDKLAEKLDREPGWRRIYEDDFAIVHVRDPQARPRAPAPRQASVQ